MRRATRASLYVAYLLAVVLLVTWVSHHVYYRRIARRASPVGASREATGIDLSTWSRLGWVGDPSRRATSFLNFDRQKPHGRIRIGCFGDSLTWGYEVADGHDYPGQLQRLVREAGYPNVDVLNFGANAYGFHQTYSAWAELGVTYDLDYAIILPIGAWVARDGSFRAEEDRSYRKYHARYILTERSVRLVDVLGDTDLERFEQYNAFVPRLRYLRYDREPPALLRALLPSGRSLPNPFYYYSGSGRQEALESYRRLLKEMSDDQRTKAIVMLTRTIPTDSFVRKLAKEKRGDWIRSADIAWGGSFLYEMPGHHGSSWANERIAAQVLWTLSGEGAGSVDTIVLRDLPHPAASKPAKAAALTMLKRRQRVSVTLQGTPVGAFHEYRIGGLRPRRVDSFPEDVESLVAFRTTGRTLADALFVPFAGSLSEGDLVEVRSWTGRISTVAKLGSLRHFQDVYQADICTEPLMRALSLKARGPCHAARWRRQRRVGERSASVLVHGRPVLEVFVSPNDDEVELSPAERFYRLRADPDAGPQREHLGPWGVVALRVEDTEVGATEIPLARWKRTKAPLDSVLLSSDQRLTAMRRPNGTADEYTAARR